MYLGKEKSHRCVQYCASDFIIVLLNLCLMPIKWIFNFTLSNFGQMFVFNSIVYVEIRHLIIRSQIAGRLNCVCLQMEKNSLDLIFFINLLKRAIILRQHTATSLLSMFQQ